MYNEFSYHCILILKCFYHPKKKPMLLSRGSPFVLPRPLLTTNLPCESVDLSVLDVSYKLNQTLYDFYVASVTERHVYKVQPCRSVSVLPSLLGHNNIPVCRSGGHICLFLSPRVSCLDQCNPHCPLLPPVCSTRSSHQRAPASA